MLEGYNVILASNSPRRQELLKGLDIDFCVKTIKDIDESYPDNLSGEDIPLFIAKKKAEAYKTLLSDNKLFITADTIVWNNGKVLGKPSDKDDAVRMISALAGKTHTVYTGVCIVSEKRQVQFVDATEVKFADLSADEIEFYVKKYKPMDKAGAYGVQEWIGYVGVEWIKGSFYNVMGLPVHRLYSELKKF